MQKTHILKSKNMAINNGIIVIYSHIFTFKKTLRVVNHGHSGIIITNIIN